MNDDIIDNDPVGGDIARLMNEYDIDQETAEKVEELVGEGLDEDEAIEAAEEF
jgi:hypothetical protein